MFRASRLLNRSIARRTNRRQQDVVGGRQEKRVSDSR
jgi:hypothetical protein